MRSAARHVRVAGGVDGGLARMMSGWVVRAEGVHHVATGVNVKDFLQVTVTLEAGWSDTYTQRAIPGSEPGRILAPWIRQNLRIRRRARACPETSSRVRFFAASSLFPRRSVLRDPPLCGGVAAGIAAQHEHRPSASQAAHTRLGAATCERSVLSPVAPAGCGRCCCCQLRALPRLSSHNVQDPGLLTSCEPSAGLNVADLRTYWNRLRVRRPGAMKIDAR